jgi:hypothetical protein
MVPDEDKISENIFNLSGVENIPATNDNVKYRKGFEVYGYLTLCSILRPLVRHSIEPLVDLPLFDFFEKKNFFILDCIGKGEINLYNDLEAPEVVAFLHTLNSDKEYSL